MTEALVDSCRREVSRCRAALTAGSPRDGRGAAVSDLCGCGKRMRWVQMGSGKRMPLDAEPDPVKGNIALVGGVWCVLSRAELADLGGDRPRYTSHFATCPDAAKHRRPRG